MPFSANSKAFAARLEEACDQQKIPLRGRQSAIARRLKVTQQAVRKWRAGEAYPDMSRAIELSNWLCVNVVWLLQGTGPKCGERINDSTRLISEAIEHLPHEERGRVLNYLRFELQEHPGWFAAETRARYVEAIDALVRKPAASDPVGTQETHARAA